MHTTIAVKQRSLNAVLPVEPKFGLALYKQMMQGHSQPLRSRTLTPRYAASDEGRMSKARATGFD